MTELASNSTLITSMFAFLGVFSTAVWSYKISRTNAQKDAVNTHRLSLSQDEKDFRSDLLHEMKSYRDEIRCLMLEVDSLRTLNTDLQTNNTLLGIKVDQLTAALNKFNNDSTTVTNTTSVTTHEKSE